MKKFDDEIPENAVRLTEVYGSVLNALNANLPELEAALDNASYPDEGIDDERSFADQIRANEAIAEIESAQRKANRFFREKLVHQEITAYVRDPETGNHVQLE